jgi:hypothetical protein
LHGKIKEIPKFHNDNFKFDFKKNQAICPAGHRMDYKRRDVKRKETGNWTNVYRTNKCKGCPLKIECVGNKKSYREVKITPLMRKIRLRFKTKKGLKKYNKRFHKGK